MGQSPRLTLKGNAFSVAMNCYKALPNPSSSTAPSPELVLRNDRLVDRRYLTFLLDDFVYDIANCLKEELSAGLALAIAAAIAKEPAVNVLGSF